MSASAADFQPAALDATQAIGRQRRDRAVKTALIDRPKNFAGGGRLPATRR
jgi:hypothetical protein